jgi:hypothetical protein
VQAEAIDVATNVECRMDSTYRGMDDPFMKNVSCFFTLNEDEARSTTVTNILTQHHAKRHVGREDQADGHGVKRATKLKTGSTSQG